MGTEVRPRPRQTHDRISHSHQRIRRNISAVSARIMGANTGPHAGRSISTLEPGMLLVLESMWSGRPDTSCYERIFDGMAQAHVGQYCAFVGLSIQ